MKTTRIAMYIIGVTVLMMLAGSSKAFAQFEIDPDHYETPAEVANTHYEGKFTLPYTVQCHGRSLPPGKYSVSLDSDGKTGRVTLLRKGQSVKIQGIAQRENRPSRSAIVVEQSGGTPRLSMIHAAQLDVRFDSEQNPKLSGPQRKIERLALASTNSRER